MLSGVGDLLDQLINMKKLLIILFSLCIPIVTHAQLTIPSGGTGQASYSTGDTLYATAGQLRFNKLTIGSSGTCLTSNGTIPSWGSCSSGGSGSGGTWSTTTSQTAGILINYPNNTTDVVTIGSNSTTTAQFYFDPNTLRALFNGPLTLPYLTATSTTGTSTFGGDVKIGSDTRNNMLSLTPTRNYSNSVSVGGALNITNSSSNGVGLEVYSTNSAPSGRLVVFNCDNQGFNQDCLRVVGQGNGNAIAISQTGTSNGTVGLNVSSSGNSDAISVTETGTSTTASALQLVSSNNAESTLSISGVETGRGTIKVTHTGNSVSDSNSAALSIDLQATTTPTGAQGIFITSTTGGTTGKLLNIRNDLAALGGASGQVELLTMLAGGNLGLGSTTPLQVLSVQGNTIISGNIVSVANITATGTLTLSALTGTQCLHEISGVVSGTGSDCGSSGSSASTTLLADNNTFSGINQFTTIGTTTFSNSISFTSASTTATSTFLGLRLMGLTGLPRGSYLAIDPSGSIIATNTPVLSLANGTGISCSANTASGIGSCSFSNQSGNTVLVNQANGNGVPTGLATSTFGNTLYQGYGASSTVLITDGTVPRFQKLATSQITNDSGFITSSGVSAGVAGQLAVYNTSGTTVSGTSTGLITVGALIASSTTATSSFMGTTSFGSTTPMQSSLFSIGTSTPLFTVDKNTGNMWFDAGVEFIDSRNNLIGIGTTTPTWALNIFAPNGGKLAFSAGAGVAQWVTGVQNDGSYYWATTTVQGNATTTNNPPALQLYPTGSFLLGVGTSTPWLKFGFVGTAVWKGLNTANTPVGYMCFDANDQLINSSSACTISDENKKTDIQAADQSIESGLKYLLQLNPITYRLKSDVLGDYKGDRNRAGDQFGLSAQQVAAIDERLVYLDDQGQPKSIRYDGVTAVLVQAVKDIYAQFFTIFQNHDGRITTLENEVMFQKGQIDQLSQQVESLKTLINKQNQ